MSRAVRILAIALAFAGCGDDTPDAGVEPDRDRELIAAAYDNDVDRARELIAAGADVNAKDAKEQSAYLIATSEVGPDPALLEAIVLGDGGAAHVETVPCWCATARTSTSPTARERARSSTPSGAASPRSPGSCAARVPADRRGLTAPLPVVALGA